MVASWFGVEAKHEADRANLKSDEAEREKAAALEARNKEQNANHALVQQRDRLEGALVRRWLVPLSRQPGPLTGPEANALEELGAQRDERLARRFVHEGLTDARYFPGFAARVEYAWQAGLGLDRQRRAEAEQWLLAELQSAPLESQRRQDLSLAATALRDLSPETAGVRGEALARALGKNIDPNTLLILADGLSALAARMEPKEAAEAIVTLTQAMSKVTDTSTLFCLPEALPALAARIDSKEAAAMLIQAMSKTTNPSALGFLAEGLSREPSAWSRKRPPCSPRP